jgi:capsular exopolysaccharide synthesis family protein
LSEAERESGASLSFSPQEGTNIISVSSESGDPAAAAAWANAAAEEYVAFTDDSSSKALKRTQKYLEGKIAESKKKLAEAETKLLAFRSKTRLADSDEERAIRVQEAVDVEGKARDTSNELRSITAKVNAVKVRLSGMPAQVTETKTSPNPEVVALREQLSKLKTERTVALGTYTPESGMIRGLDEQIGTLQDALKDKQVLLKEETEIANPARAPLEAQLADLELQKTALSELNNQLQESAGAKSGDVSHFAPWQVKVAQIQRERDLAEKTYLDFSEKLRTLDVRDQAMVASATVMEPATVPSSPIRPQKAQQVGVSMVLGLLLGLAFALLQEFLDDRVSTSEDVDRLLSLPTLGLVPTIGTGLEKLLSAQPDLTRFTESYRSLRLGVQFSAIDTPVRTMVITSPHSGDGKSLTSANLAIAMAQEGKRVILVDADLRRPTQHRAFNLEVDPGLTSIIAGQATLADTLRASHVEGLRVLCAGPLPPNPPELLNSLSMQRLIEELKAEADFIIFDAPPLLPVTDAQVLASRTDGVILVIQSGRARKPAVKQATEMLEQARAHILGIVLNKIDQSNKGYYYHYYAHGDSYGYTGYYHGRSRDESRAALAGAGNGSGNGHRQSGSATATLSDSDELEVAEKPTLPTRLRDWE